MREDGAVEGLVERSQIVQILGIFQTGAATHDGFDLHGGAQAHFLNRVVKGGRDFASRQEISNRRAQMSAHIRLARFIVRIEDEEAKKLATARDRVYVDVAKELPELLSI